MKKVILDFLHRGVVACGLGPMVLVVFYLILQRHCGLQTLTVTEVCVGILSLSALAFVAGGMNAVYQIEQLPLMVAILIHGGVLYLCYLATYLVNGWLEWGTAPILVFTAIFVVGYLAIWAVIYAIIRRRTARLNVILQKNAARPPAD
ncbi:MAG: DUF3021 domain-containing protein [Faecalibacterium sp.]|nr:DUF3021 domain-containing protein [Faecalibacterium sp.]